MAQKTHSQDLEMQLSLYGGVGVNNYHQQTKDQQVEALITQLTSAMKNVGSFLQALYEKYQCLTCRTAHN